MQKRIIALQGKLAQVRAQPQRIQVIIMVIVVLGKYSGGEQVGDHKKLITYQGFKEK